MSKQRKEGTLELVKVSELEQSKIFYGAEYEKYYDGKEAQDTKGRVWIGRKRIR